MNQQDHEEQSSSFTELREIEDRHKLIMLVYCKGDANTTILGTDEEENDIMADLTDAEWEVVRRRFEKTQDFICAQVWEQLSELTIEVIAERKQKVTDPTPKG